MPTCKLSALVITFILVICLAALSTQPSSAAPIGLSTIARLQPDPTLAPSFAITLRDDVDFAYLYPAIWHQPDLSNGPDYNIIFPNLSCSVPTQSEVDRGSFMPARVTLNLTEVPLDTVIQCAFIGSLSPNVEGMALYMYSAPADRQATIEQLNAHPHLLAAHASFPSPPTDDRTTTNQYGSPLTIQRFSTPKRDLPIGGNMTVSQPGAGTSHNLVYQANIFFPTNHRVLLDYLADSPTYTSSGFTLSTGGQTGAVFWQQWTRCYGLYFYPSGVIIAEYHPDLNNYNLHQPTFLWNHPAVDTASGDTLGALQVQCFPSIRTFHKSSATAITEQDKNKNFDLVSQFQFHIDSTDLTPMPPVQSVQQTVTSIDRVRAITTMPATSNFCAAEYHNVVFQFSSTFSLGRYEGLLIGFISTPPTTTSSIADNTLLDSGACVVEHQIPTSQYTVPKYTQRWTTRGVLLQLDMAAQSQGARENHYFYYPFYSSFLVKCTFKSNIYSVTALPQPPALADLGIYLIPRADEVSSGVEMESTQFTTFSPPTPNFFSCPTANPLTTTAEWRQLAQDIDPAEINHSSFGNQHEFKALVNFDRRVGSTLGYNPTVDGSRTAIIFTFITTAALPTAPSLTQAYIPIKANNPMHPEYNTDSFRVIAEYVSVSGVPTAAMLQLFFLFDPTTAMPNANGINLKTYGLKVAVAQWLYDVVDLSAYKVSLANCDTSTGVCTNNIDLYPDLVYNNLPYDSQHLPATNPPVLVYREVPPVEVSLWDVTKNHLITQLAALNDTIAITITRPLSPQECLLPTDAIELTDVFGCFDVGEMDCILIPHPLAFGGVNAAGFVSQRITPQRIDGVDKYYLPLRYQNLIPEDYQTPQCHTDAIKDNNSTLWGEPLEDFVQFQCTTKINPNITLPTVVEELNGHGLSCGWQASLVEGREDKTTFYPPVAPQPPAQLLRIPPAVVMGGEYEWLCKHPLTTLWAACDDPAFDAVHTQPCPNPADCYCVYPRATPTCAVRGGSDLDIAPNATLCSKQSSSPSFQDIIVNHKVRCARCGQFLATRYDWGLNCEVPPTLSNFRYAPSNNSGFAVVNADGSVLRMDYSGVIDFHWEYLGSPNSDITIYAQSAALAPFDVFPIVTIPVITPQPALGSLGTAINKEMRFSYSINTLLFNHPMNNITFFTVLSKNITTQQPTPTPQQPLLQLPPRCLSASGATLCQHNGVCNLTTGQCDCDPTDIWQRGVYCEKSLCDELNCIKEHINPKAQHSCSIISSSPSSSSAEIVYTPQCNCDGLWYSGEYCEVDIDCVANNTITCPTTKAMWVAPADHTTTTNTCECQCQGSWSTATTKNNTQLCNQCNLRCLNNGRDNAKCLSACTCPTTSSTGTLYYGMSCECKALNIRASIPIGQAQLNYIVEKQKDLGDFLRTISALQTNTTIAIPTTRVVDPVEVMIGQYDLFDVKQDNIMPPDATIVTATQLSNTYNTYHQQQAHKNPFTMFMKSIVHGLLVDYRNTLVYANNNNPNNDENDNNTARLQQLYHYDASSSQFIIPFDNPENNKLISIIDFDLKEITTTPTTKAYYLTVSYSIADKIQCVPHNGAINDTLWWETLRELEKLSELLDFNGLNRPNTTTTNDGDDGDGGGGGGDNDDDAIFTLYDPLCQNTKCNGNKPKQNNSASSHSSSLFTIFCLMLTTAIAMVLFD